MPLEETALMLEQVLYASAASRQSRPTRTGTYRMRSVKDVSDDCAATVASRRKRRRCGIVARALLKRGRCRFGARPRRGGVTASCLSISLLVAQSEGRREWNARETLRN